MAVAVAQDSSYSSDLTPSLGISICLGCGPKNKQNKTKTKKEKKRKKKNKNKTAYKIFLTSCSNSLCHLSTG